MTALALGIPWLAAAALAAADGRRRFVVVAAAAALLAGLAAVLARTVLVVSDGPRELTTGGWAAGIGITLRVDALGALFALTSLVVVAAAFLHEAALGISSRTFPALVLFLSAGLTGLFLTGDIFNFYVFFELSLIAAYVLTTYGNESRQVGAALIFAVVNLVGSFVFLIGVAALYHVTGSLEMRQVAARMSEVDPNSAILIAATFFVAFGVKLGLFPFHFWLPAVYTGCRPAVAAILSGALASVGAYGVLRFGAGLMPAELALGTGVLVVLGAATIVYGSLQAVSRRAANEVLAYSAIGQVGYVLIALAVGGVVGYAAAVLYTLANALNKALLFLAVGLRGRLVAAAFALGALSTTGVPPTAGFFAKLEVFRAALADAGPAVVAVLFLGSALSFVYLFQLYQRWYWREEGGPAAAPAGPGRQAVTVAVAAVVLGLGIWPEPILAAAQEAAAALLGGGP